jgi:succinyl-diaminopimelate desuccinylase
LTSPSLHQQLDHWIDTHFDQELAFLQALVRVPTDTPPGNNTPHAEHTAHLLEAMGWATELHPVPQDQVHSAGMQSVTNLIVRRRYGTAGPTIGLNAHGDVVPPGAGWTHAPYGAEIVNGALYGRASAVSKSDFATYTFAVRALESLGLPLQGGVDLLFTYDEEFGGSLGPAWLLERQLTRPDWVIAAGFSYQVVTAHNGCLQLEVRVQGKMAHAAIPHTGVDALQASVHILQALYAQNAQYAQHQSKVQGIEHPTLNVGWIEGGTNTNVVPGLVRFKLDRRMIPEENPLEVEQALRQLIAQTAASLPDIGVQVDRLLLAKPLYALPGNQPLLASLQKHGQEVFHTPIPAMGSPLYTDARLFTEAGIPCVIYGAGPRTVQESHAKQADERLQLSDLHGATRVIARTLLDLLHSP